VHWSTDVVAAADVWEGIASRLPKSLLRHRCCRSASREERSPAHRLCHPNPPLHPKPAENRIVAGVAAAALGSDGKAADSVQESYLPPSHCMLCCPISCSDWPQSPPALYSLYSVKEDARAFVVAVHSALDFAAGAAAAPLLLSASFAASCTWIDLCWSRVESRLWMRKPQKQQLQTKKWSYSRSRLTFVAAFPEFGAAGIRWVVACAAALYYFEIDSLPPRRQRMRILLHRLCQFVLDEEQQMNYAAASTYLQNPSSTPRPRRYLPNLLLRYHLQDHLLR